MNKHQLFLYSLAASYRGRSSRTWEFLQEFDALKELPDAVPRVYKKALAVEGASTKPPEKPPGKVVSVFSRLQINGKSATNQVFLPYQLTDLQEVFPSQEPKGDEEMAYNGLLNELQQLNRTMKPQALAETLFFLQKKHHWGVSAGIVPDTVSLFELNKLRAGLAVCLAHFEEQTETPYPFLLASGDISGIQKFIYNIHSRKAAKALKGRSFYLYLLVESIVGHLLETTGTTLANVVYASGGKFFLLLPNTPAVRQKLENTGQKITEQLFNLHKTSLYVEMGSVAFGLRNGTVVSEATNLQGESVDSMAKLWQTVSQRTIEKKSRKFDSLLTTQYNSFFADSGLAIEGLNGKGYTPCAVTGIPVKTTDENLITKGGEEGVDIYVSKPVKKQIELGEKLRTSNLLIYGGQSANDLLNLGFPLGLSKTVETNVPAAHLNELNFIDPAKSISQRFMFYGGNRQAMATEKRVKYYDELSGSEEAGFRRLGVLRMDVDNLGKIFINSLQGEQQHFAVYSSLSAQLDLFFSGWLNALRNNSKYADHVNIVYSGGDDVFAVGRWDLIIEFAADIRKKFHEFTGNREDISISAGIAFTGGKFPVNKGAQLAGKAEDEAKKYLPSSENGILYEKNAIHFFDETVSWHKEFDFVYELTHEFFNKVKNRTLSQNLLLHFQRFKQMKDKQKPDWWWLLPYMISQHYRGAKKEVKPFLAALQSVALGKLEYHTIKYSCRRERLIDLIALAARYASYKLRNEKSKNQ